MKSFITIKANSSHSYFHNDRSKAPSYLIDGSFDCDTPAKEAIKKEKELIATAKENYKKTTGRNMRSDVKTTLEAVIRIDDNLPIEETKKRLDNLKNELFNEYNLRPIQTAIHLDEGIQKRPTADKEIKQINAHAHIVFSNFDSNGNTINRTLTKSKLAKIQTITAKTMGMDRGQENSPSKHLSHQAYRQLKEKEDLAAAAIYNADKAKEQAREEKLTAQRKQDEIDSERSLFSIIRDLKKEKQEQLEYINLNKKTLKEQEKQIKENQSSIQNAKEIYSEIQQYKGYKQDLQNVKKEMRETESKLISQKREVSSLDTDIQVKKLQSDLLDGTIKQHEPKKQEEALEYAKKAIKGRSR